ncbi:WYL domain-containing protein [Microbacterium horticulturae]|uniref:WYL domain-containing protein n=1 Tax=Microbacterium horticulturae TaxID=3028316 RepID=A0ABY8C7I5_9MICO|nr:WYL domain-containing protein [Microbacterium sp. KACC 23027]WEG10578.1 WYL domain-containing protein [Microbacterium sp. KACC 23027]
MTARPVLATDRAALMLQLVPYLIRKGEVSVAEAATDFDVTPAQMRSMVEKLTVIGRPGDNGYWQMANDLFDIDWDLLDEHDRISLTNAVGLEHAPRLTAREAAALLAGLQLARSLPGVGDSGVVAGLLAKLAGGASSTPADLIVAPEPVDDVRGSVDEALRHGVAVSFTYKAPDAPATTRTVDPVKVHIAEGQWYLQGWCHLRQAMRTFHLDRVSDLVLTDIAITHGEEQPPALFDMGETGNLVHIRFPAAVASLLRGYLDRAQAVTTSGELTQATIRVADPTSLKRLAAGRGGDVEILEPAGAREAAAEWARSALEQYTGDDSQGRAVSDSAHPEG